ncbi:MAG: group III truncated hemoglobin [Pseudomonadota bacterium]
MQSSIGIDDAMIEKLVHSFYARVHSDPLIGPVFIARIANWDLHLQRMCLFWSSVVLMSGRYHGAPMQKHMPLPVDAQHFDRWLQLFRQTALAVCPPEAAQLFCKRAELIARSLELGVATANGALLGKGQRYVAALPTASTGAEP